MPDSPGPGCAANASSVLSSCGWMYNGWCVLTRILMLSGGEKMISDADAVDTFKFIMSNFSPYMHPHSVMSMYP